MRFLIGLVVFLMLAKAYDHGCVVSMNGDAYSIGFHDAEDMGASSAGPR